MTRSNIVGKFWQEHRLRFILLIVFTFAYTLFLLIFPYILKDIIDGIRVHFTTAMLYRSIVMLGIIGLFRSILGMLLPFTRGWTNEMFFRSQRTGLFSELLKKGHRFMNRYPVGDVLERADADLGELSWFACSGIFRPVEGILTIVVALFFLVKINWRLTVICVMPMSLAIFTWMRYSPLIYKFYQRWRELMSQVHSFLQASFAGIRIVKAYTMEARNSRGFSQLLQRRVEAAIKVIRTDAKVNVLFTSIEEIGILLILIFGGIYTIRSSLTIGEFIAFNAYILLLLNPMINIGNFFVVKKRSDVQNQRLVEIAYYPAEIIDQGRDVQGLFREITFDHVSFGYDDQAPLVLQDINLKIAASNKIGIAGPVGSGKTTLLKLLIRIAEPTKGKVFINDKTDIKSLRLCDYRKLFGYTPQEPILFSDTVSNNITFGLDYSADKINSVIKFARLGDFLNNPKGLDQLVGERGLKLSGGEKQRVAIGRTLIVDPKIFVFDDATSNLDAETEKVLFANFNDTPDSTVIIVSHRLSVLAQCDYIYVLDQGRIVEQGSHESLFGKKGLYWKLYRYQMAEY